jgi:hypothetical protein
MQIRRNKKDKFWDWRQRFAAFPTRIGDRIVWLERYRWRHRPSPRNCFLLASAFSHDYEMETRHGYSAVLTVSGMYGGLFKTRTWKLPRPELNGNSARIPGVQPGEG